MDRIELLDSGAWKDRVADSTVASGIKAEDYGVLKGVTADVVKAEGEDDRTLDFIVSDDQPDRDQDVIALSGWDLKQWRKNPVVLWSHDSYSPPIAAGVKIWKEDGTLRSRARFQEADLNPFADMIFRMLVGKFLRATSVGFIARQWEWSEDNENRPRGIDFMKQELIEWSVVPIPANPRALIQNAGKQASDATFAQAFLAAHAAGIDTRPLKGWCERKLDREGDPLRGLTPGDVLDAYRAFGGERLVIDMGGLKGAEPMEPEEAPETPVNANVHEMGTPKDSPSEPEPVDTPPVDPTVLSFERSGDQFAVLVNGIERCLTDDPREFFLEDGKLKQKRLRPEESATVVSLSDEDLEDYIVEPPEEPKGWDLEAVKRAAAAVVADL